MEYRRLGQSGLKLSALSLGSWVTFRNQVDVRLAEQLLKTAYDQGVNFFDNAETYANGESEFIMGQALKRLGWARDSFCVSSKVFFGSRDQPLPTQRGLSRKHVTEACHQALARLQVDYLDLYFCHRPDPEAPIEETVRAMHTLVQQGKVLYWGTSEWSAEEITTAHKVAQAQHLTPPSMEQPQYNLFHRERVEKEYAPLYRAYGMGTTIWSPLASGVLSGKYNRGIPGDSRLNLPGYEWLRDKLETAEGRRRLVAVEKLAAIARELGMSLSQLAIAWCLKKPQVSTVILGASRLEQLQENLGALAQIAKLVPEVVARIEAAAGA
ncbi:MAG: aldo/keto reductase [Gammaproteobacteria bacterium]|nr:aldo/keto reductase [Gammaproteobacteria bacterium]MBU6509485.1 aldo/keto reductase [Gammaproteobacteria bacterium]MDE1984154.1 aldo/keto reductase [Gammaproteobacteria bacterium]MDE2108651.1 aldo/keto reductase [Gammaproteobacteria bacterium]MDE2460578.1 aldo/keto reductase [Gammaproteobacteria bacterium]